MEKMRQRINILPNKINKAELRVKLHIFSLAVDMRIVIFERIPTKCMKTFKWIIVGEERRGARINEAVNRNKCILKKSK